MIQSQVIGETDGAQIDEEHINDDDSEEGKGMDEPMELSTEEEKVDEYIASEGDTMDEDDEPDADDSIYIDVESQDINVATQEVIPASSDIDEANTIAQ